MKAEWRWLCLRRWLCHGGRVGQGGLLGGLCVCLMSMLLSVPVQAMTADVVVLTDTGRAAYVEALRGFSAHSQAQIKVLSLRDSTGRLLPTAGLLARIRRQRPDQLVVLGNEALQAVQHQVLGMPLLFALCSGDPAADAVPNTGVRMQVAPAQQVALLHLLAPDLVRLSSLYGDTGRTAVVQDMAQAMQEQGMTLQAQRLDDARQGLRQLHGLLHAISLEQGYWLQNDSLMYDNGMMRYMAHHLGRKEVLVLAPSSRFVSLGALLAVEVSPYQQGEQLVVISNALLRGEKLTQWPVQYARHGRPVINRSTAQHLGLVIPAGASLLRGARYLP